MAFEDEQTVTVAPEAGSEPMRFSLEADNLRSRAFDRVHRGFSSEECATYGIDPCPTLEEMRAR